MNETDYEILDLDELEDSLDYGIDDLESDNSTNGTDFEYGDYNGTEPEDSSG